MIATLAMTLVLSCEMARRPVPVPQVSSACEGADRVERNWDGYEVRRFSNACTIARCEGADFVRRTLNGVATQRFVWSPSCITVSCEGLDFVRRDSDGRELQRFESQNRCFPRPVWPRVPAPQNDVLKFGLSQR